MIEVGLFFLFFLFFLLFCLFKSEEFRHPLSNHPDLGPLSDLQQAIAECISAGGDSCSLNAIQTHVAKKWKQLRRRDGTEYPSLQELRRAVVDVLRPNPRAPNLFRKEESSRSDRNQYRMNNTVEEALESMRAASGENKRAKYVR